MKKLLLPLIFLLGLIGCKEDIEPVAFLEGEWELVLIESTWFDEAHTGEEMSYQQTYVFRSNGTFTKTRSADGELFTATGTYTTAEEENNSLAAIRLNILLAYTEGEELGQSCSGPNVELLVLRNTNQLTNTWDMCDGPRLTYEKK